MFVMSLVNKHVINPALCLKTTNLSSSIQHARLCREFTGFNLYKWDTEIGFINFVH